MRFFYTLLFLFFGLNLSAQFTHIEADLGYQYIRFRKGDVIDDNVKVKTNVLSASFTGILRPNRFIGVGLSIGLPLTQVTRWGFYDAPTSDGSQLYDDDNSFTNNLGYSPTTYEYSIHHSPSITFLARLFFKPEAAINIDLRYTFLNINETFQFERSGANALTINHDKKRTARGPGLSLVYNYFLENGFYIKYQYTVDFLTIDRVPSLNYNIAYGNDSYTGREETVRIASPIEQTHRMHNWVMGLGYYF